MSFEPSFYKLHTISINYLGNICMKNILFAFRALDRKDTKKNNLHDKHVKNSTISYTISEKENKEYDQTKKRKQQIQIQLIK